MMLAKTWHVFLRCKYDVFVCDKILQGFQKLSVGEETIRAGEHKRWKQSRLKLKSVLIIYMSLLLLYTICWSMGMICREHFMGSWLATCEKKQSVLLFLVCALIATT